MPTHPMSPAPRLARWAFLCGALALTAFSGMPSAQPLPGTDLRSWATADITALLSYRGTWAPMDTTAGFVGPFWDVARVGPENREAVILAGWAFNGSFQSTLPDTTPTRSAILLQQPDGTLADATTELWGNATTNGTGSVVVADFNGDGRDDVVLPAHNESPFILKSSVAFMSQPDGSMARLELPDAAMNHDAQLYRVNGVNKIIARSFGTLSHGGTELSTALLYTWDAANANFSVKKLGNWGGMTIAGGRFDGGLDEHMVMAEMNFGPGVPYSPSNPGLHFAYKFIADNIVRPPFPLPKPYFNDKPEYAEFRSQFDPISKTHTPRIKATDLNQDGRLDVLALSTLWYEAQDGHQKGVLQEMINLGNMQFRDDTDALSPGISKDTVIDYSTKLWDVDGSGIPTIFAASALQPSAAKDAAQQGQAIYVNDGTGRLSVAMHDEFRAMTAQISAFLRPRLPGGYGMNPSQTPQFIPYRTRENTINFIVVARLGRPANTPITFAFVNVPLGINLTTDVREDMVVPTRHGSRRIRTFAGNDTIHRQRLDPDCTVDGGLGRNVAVYPGRRADWSVIHRDGTVIIRPVAGAGGVDTLRRVQIARFDDGEVDLTQ